MFEEKQRYEYDLTPRSVVIDAGVHNGEFSRKISELYNPLIFGFEPIFGFYWGALSMLTHFEKVKLFNAALTGALGGHERFYVQGDRTGRFEEKGEVESCTLCPIESALLLLRLRQVHLLKLNIEGSEFELLEHVVAANIQDRFTNIQVQWHDVVPGGPMRREHIIRHLLKTHELTFDADWTWQNFRLK